MAVLLVALAAAAFAAFAAARFFGGGRFLGLNQHLSRYRVDSGWLAGTDRFSGRAACCCWRFCCPPWPEKISREFLAPGLYHYYDSKKFGAKRIHLRVEKDGSAILMIDAYRVVHLNPTATVMVKYFLDDYPETKIVRRLAAAFHIAESQGRPRLSLTAGKNRPADQPQRHLPGHLF